MARIQTLVAVLALCLFVAGCKSKVTKPNFEKIKDGMTLAEVETILGKGSKETGDGSNMAGQFGVDVGGLGGGTAGRGESYKWESNTATVTLMFRDGKVVHKRSEGF